MDHTWEEKRRWHILNGDTDYAVFKTPAEDGQFLFSFKGPKKQSAFGYAKSLKQAKDWVEVIREWHDTPAKWMRMPFPLELQAA